MKNDKPNNSTENQNPAEFPVIYSYTRAQAIDDGVLVDLSNLAKEAGFKWPVAITCGVYELLNDTHQASQSFEGRAWDLLMVLHFEIKRSKNGDVVYFAPYFNASTHSEPRPYKLWSKCGPGDHGEPVITIMLIDED